MCPHVRALYGHFTPRYYRIRRAEPTPQLRWLRRPYQPGGEGRLYNPGPGTVDSQTQKHLTTTSLPQLKMDSEVAALVVDNGSGMCKAGFAGDDAPR